MIHSCANYYKKIYKYTWSNQYTNEIGTYYNVCSNARCYTILMSLKRGYQNWVWLIAKENLSDNTSFWIINNSITLHACH